jgi:hypothetical protein
MGTVAPPGGSCSRIVPASRPEERVTTRPRARSRELSSACAASSVRPMRLGTMMAGEPDEMTKSTGWPRLTSVSARGFCSTTVPVADLDWLRAS